MARAMVGTVREQGERVDFERKNLMKRDRQRIEGQGLPVEGGAMAHNVVYTEIR